MGSSDFLLAAVALAATALAAQTSANKTTSSTALARTATLWSSAFSTNTSKPGDMDGQSSINVKQPLKRKVDFDADFAKYLGLASQDQTSKFLASQGGTYKAPLAYDGSREALRALVELPRALIGSTPASYAYFMQMHPASDGFDHDEKSVKFVHFHPQTPRSGTLKGNAPTHAGQPFRDSSGKRTQIRERPESDRVRPFKSQFASSVHFPTDPFSPIKVPTTFTHGNPLAQKDLHILLKNPGKFKQEVIVENHFASKDVPRELFHGKNVFVGLDLKNVPFRFGNTRNHLDTDPHHVNEQLGSAPLAYSPGKYAGFVIRGPSKPSHFKNFHGTKSGKAVSATGFRKPDTPTPTVREYDPYSSKFRVVATADAHDSKELRYTPPTKERYTPERPSIASSGEEETVSREADIKLPAAVRPSFYEVRENQHQEHDLEDHTDADCGKKPYKTSPTATLFQQNQFRFISPPKASPTKLGVSDFKTKFIGNQNPKYESSGEQYLARYHNSPRGRQRVTPGYSLPLEDTRGVPESGANSAEQTVPIFEFKNPVNSFVSGYATGGSPAHSDDEGALGPEEVLSAGGGRGENIEDEKSAEADEHLEQDQPPHLQEGEAQAEALDEEDEKKMFPQEDEKVFGSFEVFHSQLEPNKGEFKPFVRFPFETERRKLKTMVDDLLKVG